MKVTIAPEGGHKAGLRRRLLSQALGSRPDQPFPLWREQPQNSRDQEQGWNIAHEMAVFELLHELTADGLTVLLVSHQLNLVARFADEIVLLHEGRIAASGAPDDVMRASVLERVYDWPLVVTRDPAVGAPALLPLRVRRLT